MTGGNPFHEQGDNERTAILRPVPGGGVLPRAVVPPAFQQTGSQQPGGQQLGSGAAAAGIAAGVAAAPPQSVTLPPSAAPRLLVAATPLLQLLGRLGNTYSPPDPAALRQRAIEMVQGFERACTEAGIAPATMQSARYALCASLDDAVRHTNWGSTGIWVQASLVSTFGQGVVSGEGFFGQLAILKKNPSANLDQLALMYLCLSLGYMGQYRLSARGPAELSLIREDLYGTLVRLRGSLDLTLSPHWRGVDAPYRRARARLPLWVGALCVAGLIGFAYYEAATRLGTVSGASFTGHPPLKMPELARAPMPPQKAAKPESPQVPQPQVPQPQIALMPLGFLQPEIDQGLVKVEQNAQRVTVRIFSEGMFDSGSATLKPKYIGLLQRIGDALNTERGHVTVTGFTDNQKINNVEFPSNYELSLKRALASVAVMVPRLHDAMRMTAVGLSEANPIASNDTAKGREQNRRIEINLQREP